MPKKISIHVLQQKYMANKPEAIFVLQMEVKKDKTQLFCLKNIKTMAFPGLRCFVVVFVAGSYKKGQEITLTL